MNVLREEFAGNASVLSQIEDADYAKETAELVRSQILEQTTIKAIAIERENAERVLDLITGTQQG
jgi:flagellin-like hook-associated protein FlgL